MQIPFTELHKYNDSNSFVWMALEFNPNEKDDIEKFLKESNFMPPDSSILEMKKIAGNVNGEDKRTDVLFITSPTHFNPLARLRIPDLKWTSWYLFCFRS